MAADNQRSKIDKGPEILTIYPSSETHFQVLPDAYVESEKPSDFEKAVEATGYGLYNYLLLLAVIPGGWASFFDMTTMSYVLPSAECDLNLTLFQKGVLNAITYAGMMSSAFVWGFLADTRGRRSLIRFGYLADAVCNVLCSMSQSFYVLVTFKFFSGFIVNGPFAIAMTYLAEFHGVRHRSQTMLWASLFPALGNAVLPAMAWAVIPEEWSFSLFDGALVYNSWHIFLLVCSMPAWLAFLTLIYFPESPKFLMSQGRNDEALVVFRKMYTMNTGNPPEDYPIKVLREERQVQNSANPIALTVGGKMRDGWAQIKPLFRRPYLGKFLLIVTIQFGGILSLNTLRLWVPQLFTYIENFNYDSQNGSPTLCEMISVSNLENVTVNDDFNITLSSDCFVVPVPGRVYLNSIIIACTSVIGYTLAGSFVNLLGKKSLLLVAYAVPAVCSLAVNWSPDNHLTLAILAVYMALTAISVSTIITVIVDLMPTSLRTMAVSLTMCIGRSGAVLGNLLFPILLSTGCMIPFAFVGGFLIVCFLLTIFIPKPPAKLM